MPLPHSFEGACRIDDLGVIRARGADAAKFLQGQLTNDVLGLGPDRARLAGFCSAKGRLQASFVIWKAADDEFLLACSSSLLAPTLKRLSMFVLRSQCRLSDVSAEVLLWGLVGATATTPLADAATWEKRDPGGAALIRLPDAVGTARALLAAPSGTEPASAAGSPLPLDIWRWLEVRSGIVTIEAATVDRFVPQMVNFELVGGVDFQKGCYPGQEVVARSQYRGTTKRRTFLFEGQAVASPGQDVFLAGSTGEPAGTVANAAASPEGGGIALVELRLAALGDGELRLGSGDGPALHRLPLPYPMPIDSEATA
ncbi:MAG: folate-binding protein [Caldimonas sp.]